MDMLSLNYNETVVIDMGEDKVKITLLENKENTEEFTLGIEAPRRVAVNHEESHQKKKLASKS
jgi:sRNA-binding carbon storage regulator CsrA